MLPDMGQDLPGEVGLQLNARIIDGYVLTENTQASLRLRMCGQIFGHWEWSVSKIDIWIPRFPPKKKPVGENAAVKL